MKLTLLTDDRIRYEVTAGALTIEPASPEQHLSPFHMLAGGLASCVFSVLYSWADNAGLSADDLAIEVEWEFTDGPYRVGEYRVALLWPSLPQTRRAAAERAAHLCPIHQTLEHPTRVETHIRDT